MATVKLVMVGFLILVGQTGQWIFLNRCHVISPSGCGDDKSKSIHCKTFVQRFVYQLIPDPTQTVNKAIWEVLISQSKSIQDAVGHVYSQPNRGMLVQLRYAFIMNPSHKCGCSSQFVAIYMDLNVRGAIRFLSIKLDTFYSILHISTLSQFLKNIS